MINIHNSFLIFITAYTNKFQIKQYKNLILNTIKNKIKNFLNHLNHLNSQNKQFN